MDEVLWNYFCYLNCKKDGNINKMQWNLYYSFNRGTLPWGFPDPCDLATSPSYLRPWTWNLLVSNNVLPFNDFCAKNCLKYGYYWNICSFITKRLNTIPLRIQYVFNKYQITSRNVLWSRTPSTQLLNFLVTFVCQLSV